MDWNHQKNKMPLSYDGWKKSQSKGYEILYTVDL